MNISPENLPQTVEGTLIYDSMLIRSTLPDIGIAWADFFVGKSLYDLYMRGDK